MNRGRSYITSVGLTAAGLSLIAPAVAQEVSGLTATFGVKQSIVTSDNLDLRGTANSGTRGVTALSFGLVSETRTSRLALNTSGNFEFDDEDTGFTDPTASLSYLMSAKNSQLALQANYSERDVNSLTTVFADTNGFGLNEQLVLGTGTRRTTGANLNFETGLDAPVGFSFDLGYRFTDYSDTTDPDLFETERLTYGATMRMQVSSTVSMRFGVELENYEAQDNSNTIRDNRSLFWSSDIALRSDLSATTRLSYSRNESTTTSALSGFGFGSGTSTNTEEGFGGGFTSTQTLQNGTVGANFNTSITTDGRRDTIRFTRAINLPRGAFSLSVGAVKTESSDPQPLVDMSYNQDMPRGRLSLGLSQSASIADDDNTVINTRLRASYDQEINASSSWGLSALLADSDAVDRDDDTRRLDLGVDYRHELARDWDMVANYTYSSSEQSGEDNRTSNKVSLSIERAFQFRP
jgi:hypothetical protein